jgi:IPT/TIG domain
VFPPRGRWIGGNTMRVTGRGFREGTVVRVGGRECEATTLLSATQIACQLPPGRGRGYVTATVGGRTSAVFGTHDYEWI